MKPARLFDVSVCAVCLALLGSFAWHAAYGKRSLANIALSAERLTRLEQRRAALIDKRDRLLDRVRLLRPASVDPDMVDELARQWLAFARPDDLIIMIDASAPSVGERSR